ncbi:MAG: galactose mutarotase [Ruminococcaceae bacterium]|nr:galactose mutarotase [Oscillospiraceae bacterium]
MSAVKITQQSLGKISTGEEIITYRLENGTGAYCNIVNYGGAITNIVVPDKNGKLDDVIIGYDTAESIEAWGGHFGKLVGRFANRIAEGKFTLNGKTYELAKNNGENHLHGGPGGFHVKFWDGEIVGDKLVLTLLSPDGDEGYPGNLKVRVEYSFDENNTLSINYEAVCDEDTIINLTNHAFFNLGGLHCKDVTGHLMKLNADRITAVKDRGCIPTGELMPVADTPLDFREFRAIGERINDFDACEQLKFGNGYDHNYVINDWDKTLKCAAVTIEPESGRKMETYTDAPGVQFYSGNGLGNYPHTRGKLGVPHVTYQAFCLETQYFPDSVNHPEFPSCVLKKGETFKTSTQYRFSVDI